MNQIWKRKERKGVNKPWMENKEKPVKKGEIHKVTISEVSRRGDGIARIKNFVVFVPGAKKGEKVKIKIKEVRGNHATAEIAGKVSEEIEGHIEEVAEEEGALLDGRKENFL